MKTLPFTIELLEPLLATGLEGDPNAGVSLKYVAGSVLRGAVIGLYMRKNGLHELSLSDRERDLFFNGKVCYLSAYPAVEGKPSRPVPLSWQKLKDAQDEAGFFDFCFATRDQDAQYKDLGAPFFAFNNSATIIKVNPETRLAVHTQRDAKKGRSTSDDGAVFRYESVVAGTKFGGAIVGNAVLLDELKGLIDGKEVLLGGARTAGYGKARITCGAAKDSEPATAIKKDAEFTLTLLSNALLRDVNGQFQAELDDTFTLSADIIADKCFKRAELVGGFNRKWGLPLPQQLSLKAGSVFKFKAKQDIDANTIQQWLDEGIGTRRVEGFGRIAVDLNTSEELSLTDAEKSEVAAIDLTAGNGIAQTLAARMAERIARRNFANAVTGAVGQIKPQGGIRNSQLARLRLVVHGVLRGEDVAKIQEFFAGLKKTARNQFDGVKINGTKIEGWITQTIEKKDKLNSVVAAKIGGLESNGAAWEKLKLEYHLRLIDGVLARIAKENRP